MTGAPTTHIKAHCKTQNYQWQGLSLTTFVSTQALIRSLPTNHTLLERWILLFPKMASDMKNCARGCHSCRGIHGRQRCRPQCTRFRFDSLWNGTSGQIVRTHVRGRKNTDRPQTHKTNPPDPVPHWYLRFECSWLVQHDWHRASSTSFHAQMPQPKGQWLDWRWP